MLPSNSNRNNDPIAYNDHSSILCRHFPNDIVTPFSKQEDFPLSCLHFPLSPYYNHCELDLEEGYEFFLPGENHDLLLHLQQQTMTVDNNSVGETIINMPDSSKNEESTANCTNKKSHNNATDQHVTRKRSSKRDRHSKINTAKGPRDRRMRLSLEVAREFFGLQDMLGYDKGSRTVEWLLIQAKPEIKKLGKNQLSQMNHSCSVAAAAKSPSSTSEGEVVSGIAKAASISKGKPSKKEKKVRQPRKTTFRPLARDLREKARARAKARTKAKSIWGTQRFDEPKLCDIGTRNNDLNKFSSWNNLETGEESGTRDFSQQAEVALIKQLRSHDREHIRINGDTSHESSDIMNKWSPNSIFNCLHNSGINQEHQLASFLPFGKPWEA